MTERREHERGFRVPLRFVSILCVARSVGARGVMPRGSAIIIAESEEKKEYASSEVSDSTAGIR